MALARGRSASQRAKLRSIADECDSADDSADDSAEVPAIALSCKF